MLWQPSLPTHYLELTDDELATAITARRRTLGDDLLILGHHYQQDDVIRHADLTGDSLKLSQMAADEAAKRGTKFIVFCGVHFMAETADILTDESVTVILPDLSAGCSMADMAEYDDVVDAWEEIEEASRQVRFPSPSGRGVRGEGASTFIDRKLLTFARELRQNQTDAEQLMWYLLRNRRLLSCKFRRQHPVGNYIIDFFCADAQLAVELDGGQHNERSAKDYDDQRSNYLAEQDIQVLRFWNHEVLTETEAVLEAIVNALRERLDQRGGTLTPSPSPRGRGGQDALTQTRVIPITYVNSTAAIKAFVGQHGGACCTSTNAEQVFRWALNGGTQPIADDERIKIIFLPDQHLGRNTASKFGFLTEVDEAAGKGASQTAVWNPRKERGGLTAEQIRNADVLLWAGHCSVHKLFRPEHVDQAREEFAKRGGVTVLVHPECCKEVVDQADLAGSTEFIIRQIDNAPPGSNWAIGTEVHLVNRLATAAKQRGVNVRMLSDCQCLCTTMYRIDQPHLLWSLDRIIEGKPANRIKVPKQAADLARLALERMLSLVNDQPTTREPALVD